MLAKQHWAIDFTGVYTHHWLWFSFPLKTLFVLLPALFSLILLKKHSSKVFPTAKSVFSKSFLFFFRVLLFGGHRFLCRKVVFGL